MVSCSQFEGLCAATCSAQQSQAGLWGGQRRGLMTNTKTDPVYKKLFSTLSSQTNSLSPWFQLQIDSKQVLYRSFCEPQVNLSSVGSLIGWAWANRSPPGAEFSHLQGKTTCDTWISLPFPSHVDLGTCCISMLWLNLLLIGEFNLNKDYSGDRLRVFSLYFNIHMLSKCRYIEIISTTDQSRGI